jgi:RNA polymerase sigma factor (sigma-70 family)
MTDTDQDLLHRFAATGDEAVFTTLVERHQSLVLGACRRVLVDIHDAEDAAQSVFFILATKVGSIDSSRGLAPWLHRVSTNVALNAVKARRVRQLHQQEAAAMHRSEPHPDVSELLDAALCRLPERERSAIVQFHLEGRSLEEISVRSRRPVATIGSWLQRGRERLRSLLGRRGVALTTATLLAGLGSLQAVEVPAGFALATAKAAMAFSATGTATSPAALLAVKGCHAMKLAALVKSAVLVTTSLAVLGGAGLVIAADSGGPSRADANAPLGAVNHVPSPEHPYGWRADGSGRFPAANPPLSWGRTRGGSGFEAKGIVWATPLPNAGKGASSPIIVGDRIFLTTDPADITCIDKQTGRILWIRSNHAFEALSDEQRKAEPAYDEKLMPLTPQLAKADAETLDELNAQAATALTSAYRAPAAAQARKRDIEKQISTETLAIVKKPDWQYWGPGASIYGFAAMTPVSDGKHIYAFFANGVTCCYDLAGKRIWISTGKFNGAEHGNFASPVLCGNQLVIWANELRSYDTASGKPLWTVPCQPRNTYGSPFVFQAGGEYVVGSQNGTFARLSDGQPIWGGAAFDDAIPTPIVEGGMIYAHGGYKAEVGFKAYKIPASMNGDKLQAAFTFKTDWATDLGEKEKNFNQSYTASPLCVDGLVYRLTESGGVIVNDASTGDTVYRKLLPMKARTEYWSWGGASASPALAGKYIYLMDNQGTTVVIQPGRTYKEVAVNAIEESTDAKNQTQNLSTPVFEGSRMYYRSPCYLYCIGDK